MPTPKPTAAPKPTVAPTPAPVAAPTPTGRKKATYQKDLTTHTCVVTLPGGHSFSFSLSGVAKTLAQRLAFHGLIQKVMDAAAGERGAVAIEAMTAAYDQLVRGVWSERVAIDPAVRRAKIADAIVAVFGGAYAKKHGKPMSQAVALAYDKKTFGKLARDPRVAEALGRTTKDAESIL